MTQITKYEEFQTEVLDSKEIVLVDFFATWCGPCQMLTPVIESIALEFKDKVKIIKIDVDQSQDIATKYNVASIPTVILFKEGKIIDTIIGFRQKEDFINAINKA
ncbi:MAG: thioredoxin [Candidatus Shapirobacteria bacterium]|jgi:thioredoxin 1|nr:thioredoxin [Candidatus Shapirobacteria bacterium]